MSLSLCQTRQAGLRHLAASMDGGLWLDTIHLNADSIKYRLPDPKPLFALAESISMEQQPKNLRVYLDYCYKLFREYESCLKTENGSVLRRMFLHSITNDTASQKKFENLIYPPLFFMDHRIVFICICDVLAVMYDNIEYLISQKGPQGTEEILQRLDHMVESYVLKPGSSALETESKSAFEEEKRLLFA